MSVDLKYDWKRKTDRLNYDWMTDGSSLNFYKALKGEDDSVRNLYGKTSVGLEFETKGSLNDLSVYPYPIGRAKDFFWEIANQLHLEDFNDFLTGDWCFENVDSGKGGERWYDFEHSDSDPDKLVIYTENLQFTVCPTDGEPVYNATKWRLVDISYIYVKE